MLACIYALSVLTYVQLIPDIGLRCAFSPTVIQVDPNFLRDPSPRPAADLLNCTIEQIGTRTVQTWPEVLRALTELRRLPVQATDPSDPGPSLSHIQRDGETLVRVRLRSPEGESFTVWSLLGQLPLDTLLPSLLWFLLKVGLILVVGLVFWKRPSDRSTALFFCLCLVTLGAYMGGYHWSRIVTQPVLLLAFMTCGVLLPAVSLHFYLTFPRPRPVMERYPRRCLAAVYGPPLGFLAVLIGGYGWVRWTTQQLFLGTGTAEEVETALWLLKVAIYVYLCTAALWYLACVVCLVHSYRTAPDLTERNQVKWIMAGALLAVVPIGYTLYLTLYEPEAFTAGAGTWPMFAASVLFTGAFTISITRYRLMQLDQLLSSGMAYFLLSFGAGLLYYGVVFMAMLFVGSRVIPSPSLPQALLVSTTFLVLLVLLDLARGRLKKILDRRFSREKHQLDKTLRQMGRAVEQLIDPPTLARRFLQASADLLGVAHAAIYLREGEPPLFRLSGCLGPTLPLTELPPGCPLVEALRTQGVVICRGRQTDPAHRQLHLLGGEAAHALTHEGQMLALLVLGPKDLGPYSDDDLNLLAAFAQMTALALQSAERRSIIESLNRDLQSKVEKISEQQRRILALQSQLTNRSVVGVPLSAASSPEATASGSSGLDDGQALGSRIVGSSAAVRQLVHLVRKVSASESAVLLRGESGTGKELLAAVLHDNSPRAGKPFIKVHCAALSPGLLESELFGHVKGAFTGAHKDKTGRFELAHKGTLFLDEIGDVSWEVQTKLLRVLQEKTFERVGSSEPVEVDVRIIAATHQDLEQLMEEGRFRKDLYYRLNVITIPVPPLRERREDVPELTQHFLQLYAQRSGKPVPQVDDDALAALKAYDWPGNIRELQNVLERAMVVAEGPAITLTDLPPEVAAAVGTSTLRDQGFLVAGSLGIAAERHERDQRERERLVRALARANGNKAEAARALGLARSTLVSRLKKYGLT